MFKICVSQVQLCLLVSDCSRRCFWPLLSHFSVLNLTRTVFLSWCLSGKEGEATMASQCQLALCHMIVVKWECNNCNNMILAQFKPLLRQSFYLRGGERRISVWFCFLSLPFQLRLFILPTLPVANQVPLQRLHPDAHCSCRGRPPKCSLSTRGASECLICFSQLSELSGVCTVDSFVSARRRWSTRTVRTRGE